MPPVIIALLVSGAAALTAALICFIYKRRCKRLSEKVDSFLQHPHAPDYSLSESTFSMLENSVADLESALLLEKENTSDLLKQNAEFISDVSHQLKTPLAGIRLYCEMNETRETEKQLILIEKMEKLIQNLIKLESLRSDSYVMDMKPEQLSPLVNETAEDFKALYPRKTITCSGDALLRCDRAWLSEAVGNILKNSCEHTADDGTIEVLIEGSETSVSISVRDDGGGVPESALPLLFRRFYRSDAKASGSTGIGLAITKAVADKHHAGITAENRNSGLCITMCFPVIDGTEKK